MTFYVVFALLVCSGLTTSPTTSPSSTPCSAPPGFFCNGGAALICPIGAYCAGGSALNISCYPQTACTVAGLSAQPLCYWNVSTLAGTGVAGAANGVSTLSSFHNPSSITLHTNGSIIVGDDINAYVRVISSGYVSSLPQIGASNGLAYDHVRNVLVVSDYGCCGAGSGRITIAPLNGTSTPILLGLSYPAGIAVTAEGTYVFCMSTGHTVNSVTFAGVSSVVAGIGAPSWIDATGTAAAFNTPFSLAINYASSDIYVLDQGNRRIRIISAGQVSTLAGNGVAAVVDGVGTSASFIISYSGIAYDGRGSIFVTDSNRVRMMIVATRQVSTIAGIGNSAWLDGFGTSTSFFSSRQLVITDSGTIIVADYLNRRIRQLACVPCPATFYCFSGAPVLCPAGSYCPLSSIIATFCPKGSFSKAGASNCSPCPSGTFTSATGSTSCQQCPSGHYCPAGTSSWAHLNCGRGNYCPDGSGAPKPCPYQVPPSGRWGALQVQGPAFLVETAHCLNHCFWNFTSGDGVLSKC